MSKLFSRLLIIPALFAALVWAPLYASPAAQGDETTHFFNETGHTVSDLFLQYWQTRGGLALFGYPISDEFSEVSETDGKPYTVQYFERAIFQLHPENQPPYNVLLALLGSEAYKAKYPSGDPGVAPAAGGAFFEQTGHTIAGRFLEYWRANGGLANLGYPLSDEFAAKSDLNGQTYSTQYFERAVFEYHPENSAPNDVLLAQLGTLRVRAKYPNGVPQQATPASSGQPLLADDWPMYGHDAQHTNYNAAEKTISAANVAALKPLWQANLGIGRSPSGSTPSVANGRVYVGSSVPSGPNFFAFDAASGAKLWDRDLGFMDTCFYLGIGATPAISGSLVVAGGGDGAYYGFNADSGATIWRDGTDAKPSGFAWSSPLLANGRAYYGVASYCDNPSIAGEARATNLYNGSLRQALALVPPGNIGGDLWQSPALSLDGKTLVLASGELWGSPNQPYSQAMMAVDLATFTVRGANQQAAFNQDLDWGTSPVIFHDAQGRTLIAAHSKDDRYYAYDMAQVSAGPIWTKHSGTQIGLMAAYDPDARPGGILFVTAKGGFLYAVDPATGQNIWYAEGLGIAHTNIAIANGLIFMNSADVGVRILDEQTGKVLRTLVPDQVGSTFSGIAVANGRIYFLSNGYLNVWGLGG